MIYSCSELKKRLLDCCIFLNIFCGSGSASCTLREASFYYKALLKKRTVFLLKSLFKRKAV
ncbi:hypothetical protein DW958_11400 [Ruminococcus sp. AM46-18]|nr:hypothetical protein DW958_11400 [Ruminococcus sp. AM46-18]